MAASGSVEARHGTGAYDVEKETRRLVAHLSVRFPAISPEVIEYEVRSDFTRLADASVRTYVPVLVERAVSNRLRRIKTAV